MIINKYLKEFIDKFNLVQKNKAFVGKIHNYQAAILIDNFSAPSYKGYIFAHIGENTQNVKEFLNQNKKELKLFNFEVFDNAITFAVQVGLTMKAVMQNYSIAFEKMCEFLSATGIPGDGYCPSCGELMTNPVESSTAGIPVMIDADCASKREEVLKKQTEEFNNKPNNYLLGTLGAIVGGIIGSLVWVGVATLLGLFSAWVAAIIAILASVGYDMMKGKPTKAKIWIVVSITVLLSIISLFVSYLILEPDLFSSLQTNSGLMVAFVINLVLAGVFGLLGSWFALSYIKKNVRK